MPSYPSSWIDTPDGRRLHAVTRAVDDSPATVVLETGAAALRLSWSRVPPLLDATSIAYDRSAVIDSCPPGPVVLAGHSAGGPLCRVAAARSDREITGIVLVDATDEHMDAMFTPGFLRAERIRVRLGLALAHLRVLPLLFREHIASMPEDVREDLRREGFRPQAMRTFAQQTRTFLPTVASFRDNPPDRPDVPVTIISGALPGDGISEEHRRACIDAHRTTAERLGARHVIAEHSMHDVPLTDPEVVAEEINRLVA